MRKNSMIDQIKSLRHGQQLLAIVILFLVLTFAWIFLSIFAGQRESTISPALQNAAKPLTPQIDEATLETIENKRSYSDEELDNFTIYKIITVNRGKEQKVVPITYDETEEEYQVSGSLEDILGASTENDKNQPATSRTSAPSPTATTTPEISPQPNPDATIPPAL